MDVEKETNAEALLDQNNERHLEYNEPKIFQSPKANSSNNSEFKRIKSPKIYITIPELLIKNKEARSPSPKSIDNFFLDKSQGSGSNNIKVSSASKDNIMISDKLNNNDSNDKIDKPDKQNNSNINDDKNKVLVKLNDKSQKSISNLSNDDLNKEIPENNVNANNIHDSLNNQDKTADEIPLDNENNIKNANASMIEYLVNLKKSLKTRPSTLKCPYCHTQVETEVVKKCSIINIFCMIFTTPIFWAFFKCIRRKDCNCYDACHKCTSCRREIAEYSAC